MSNPRYIRILFLSLITLLFVSNALNAQDALIMTWQTDAESPTDSCIHLPFQNTPSTSYHIDWDNDGIPDTSGVTEPVTLKFDSAGTFTIQITGTFPALYFSEDTPNARKLLTIDQWGNNVWDTLSFAKCERLNFTAVDTPDLSSLTSMNEMFLNAAEFNSPIGHWDVSNVTTMERLFGEANQFNQPLNNWDVSNVTNLHSLFSDAGSFNQPLDSWDVSNVKDMGGTFGGAISFDQPLEMWDVSNVTTMASMFAGASSFNQPLASWDVDSVTDMSGMFHSANAFNQPLNGWDVSNVTNMEAMFLKAGSFNQPLDSLDVSNVTNMRNMFYRAGLFNQDISAWDVSQVEDMASMFLMATAFNQNISNWDVSNVQYMHYMFAEATAFNQPLNTWDVSKVVDMAGMFYNTPDFNRAINIWDVSKVEVMEYMFSGATSFDRNLSDWDVSSVTSMEGMFQDAEAFNRPLDTWDVSNVENTGYMFYGASSFDQNLADWDYSSISYIEYMFQGAELSRENYDALLISLSSYNLPSNLDFHGGASEYCYAETARQFLIDDLDWSIDDGGKECPADVFITTWVTNPSKDASDNELHVPISGAGTSYNIDWDGDGVPDTSGITGPITLVFDTPGMYTLEISGYFPEFKTTFSDNAGKLMSVDQWGTNPWQRLAFTGCSNLILTAVDTPDLSAVTSMEGIFWSASNLNSPVDHWDVSNVTDMSRAFRDALLFNQSLEAWDVSNVTNMAEMFRGAYTYNRSLENWDVSSVDTMEGMFRYADEFDQNLAGWDFGSLTNARDMFDGVELSLPKYDSLLMSLAAQTVNSGIDFHGGASEYCLGEAARDFLVDSLGWIISDGGRDCNGIATYWTGAVDNDWFDSDNWSDGIPSSTIIAIIDEVQSSLYPIIAAPGAECTELITKPGTFIKLISGSTLSILK